jgi:death-on-curing protein
MRFVSLEEVLALHAMILARTGGSAGLRDRSALESAVEQPHASFGGSDLYPNVEEKAAALCFSLVSNHPFVDGNKRIGHAALEMFLMRNGLELNAPVDKQESQVLRLAAGELDREELAAWVRTHVVPRR